MNKLNQKGNPFHLTNCRSKTMQLKFAMILSGALVMSCQKADPAGEFNTYLSSIETLNTPLTVGLAKPSLNFDTTLYKKFKHPDAEKPVGKLPVSDSIVLLIEQSNFSEQNIIRTASTSGRAVDTKVLYAKTEDCSSDYGHSCGRVIYIDNNKLITVTDSIRQSKISDKGEIVIGSERLRVWQRTWTIDNGGYFAAGMALSVDSTIVSELTMKLYSAGTFSKELYPEETEGSDAINPRIHFVDLDSDTPNVIVSFNYAQGGNDLESEEVAIVYFKQKDGQWSVDTVDIVPLQSLDNG